MSFNATLNVNGQPSSFTALYADTDHTALTWLEQQWVAWYIWIDNPIIATGLMSFLLHEVSLYFTLLRHLLTQAMLYRSSTSVDASPGS